MSSSIRFLFGISAVALCSGQSLGVTWIEPRDNDAGALVSIALFPDPNDPAQQGELTGIQGSLNEIAPLGGNPSGNPTGLADPQDLFAIYIADPAGFRAEANSSFGSLNTRLFLFGANGRGLLANDDQDGSVLPRLLPQATDSTFRITQPGLYYLGIAGAGNFPLGAPNGAIFNFASPTEISSADGPGGANPLSGWGGSPSFGNYFIELDGARFVPAPGAGMLLAMGGALLARRRRA